MIPFVFVAGAAALMLWWTVWRGVKSEPLDRAEHAEIYKAAVKHVTDPRKLRQIAGAFDAAGKPVHADALKKLADHHDRKAGKPAKKHTPKRKMVRHHEQEGLKLAGQSSIDQPLPEQAQAPPMQQSEKTTEGETGVSAEIIGTEDGRHWEPSGTIV